MIPGGVVEKNVRLFGAQVASISYNFTLNDGGSLQKKEKQEKEIGLCLGNRFLEDLIKIEFDPAPVSSSGWQKCQPIQNRHKILQV